MRRLSVLVLLAAACCAQVVQPVSRLNASDLPSSDPQLLAKIEKQLQIHGRTGSSNLEISVTRGVASLSGEVANYADRMAIERICRRVEGIKDIQNRLQVVPALVSDEKLVQAVKDRLAADALLNPEKIQVAASSGVLSLSGTVPTWSQRRRVAASARQVQGVSEVRNELEISDSDEALRPAADDTQVAMQLERLLHGPSPLAALELRFVLNGGEVVLEGLVPSVRQKNFLRELIYAIPGVTGVDMRQVGIVPALKVSAIDFIDENSLAANQAAVQLVLDAVQTEGTDRVHVDLIDNQLVLEGKVSSLAQQQRLLQLAKAFGGTSTIRNALSVTPISRTDEEIEHDVQNVLQRDAVLSDARIAVAVRNGAATLTGSVPDFNAKSRAARLVTRTAGLTAVDNRLIVQWSPQVADDGLKKVVEKNLQTILGAGGSQVDVTVSDGDVVLTGQIDSRAQEQDLIELVRHTDCVRSVQSNLHLPVAEGDVAIR